MNDVFKIFLFEEFMIRTIVSFTSISMKLCFQTCQLFTRASACHLKSVFANQSAISKIKWVCQTQLLHWNVLNKPMSCDFEVKFQFIQTNWKLNTFWRLKTVNNIHFLTFTTFKKGNIEDKIWRKLENKKVR